jgi:hypothetical protein
LHLVRFPNKLNENFALSLVAEGLISRGRIVKIGPLAGLFGGA